MHVRILLKGNLNKQFVNHLLYDLNTQTSFFLFLIEIPFHIAYLIWGLVTPFKR